MNQMKVNCGQKLRFFHRGLNICTELNNHSTTMQAMVTHHYKVFSTEKLDCYVKKVTYSDDVVIPEILKMNPLARSTEYVHMRTTLY